MCLFLAPRNKAAAAAASKDTFQVDLSDNRFAALVNGDSNFGIDVTSAEYKNRDTEAMKLLLAQQRKRDNNIGGNGANNNNIHEGNDKSDNSNNSNDSSNNSVVNKVNVASDLAAKLKAKSVKNSTSNQPNKKRRI